MTQRWDALRLARCGTRDRERCLMRAWEGNAPEDACARVRRAAVRSSADQRSGHLSSFWFSVTPRLCDCV